jgi:RNase H-like domain found in reverse transcriptase
MLHSKLHFNFEASHDTHSPRKLWILLGPPLLVRVCLSFLKLNSTLRLSSLISIPTALLSSKLMLLTMRSIMFYSWSMTSAELNYNIYDKKLLAIFITFKQFQPYLKGLPNTINVIHSLPTDHKNLKYFATTKLLTQQQACWSKYLS